jgi:hypothetical protein
VGFAPNGLEDGLIHDAPDVGLGRR